MNTPKLVIGLEIHVELSTKSKMFCQCSADWFSMEPNTNTCPVCLGLPGAIPVPNKKAIEYCVQLGKALNCKLNALSKFDRKHYMYPDLPKGYQISQYDMPFNYDGYYALREGKTVRIKRIHMEEDTGKLIHEGNTTYIDFNRSSVPLVEIVTEPDFDNADDVKKFLDELQVIIRYLTISDADMDKGSMRMEPNISVIVGSRQSIVDGKNTTWEQPLTPEGYPIYKVEVKNINAPSFVKKAIEFELGRQTELLQKGETPVQETRGWNNDKGVTYSQRTKENAEDYRYFAEPDIPPIEIDDIWYQNIIKDIPKLPQELITQFVQEFCIKESDAYTLTKDKTIADYFVAACAKSSSVVTPQKIANIMVNKKLDTVALSLEDFIKTATELLTPKQTDTGLLQKTIDNVINNNADVVAKYKAGNIGVLMFLVGQVMKELKGQGDATIIKEALMKVLG
jgi:aspartyl-tRNA(Asn)/glutamyl-tRNA(Gln) amidotransferase subunit B